MSAENGIRIDKRLGLMKMRILITGAAGFLGINFARLLCAQGVFQTTTGVSSKIKELVLADVDEVQPGTLPNNNRITITTKIGSISDKSFVQSLMNEKTDVVYHLAGLVSGGAEKDFELGLNINLIGTLNLLEQCRISGFAPRFIFSSSGAVYGGDLPDVIEDNQYLSPQSSYGVQKAVGELLVNDYTRKGYIDGRSLRFPIVIVRPGPPNTAVSGWASAIIREPLNGVKYECPLHKQDQALLLSIKDAAGFLLHAGRINGSEIGFDRAIQLPGITCSVSELTSALESVAGSSVLDHVHWNEDKYARFLANSWFRVDAKKAARLGFKVNQTLIDAIKDFTEQM